MTPFSNLAETLAAGGGGGSLAAIRGESGETSVTKRATDVFSGYAGV